MLELIVAFEEVGRVLRTVFVLSRQASLKMQVECQRTHRLIALGVGM